MPDLIGRITVPEITATATFPLVTDYQHGRARKRDVIVHQMGDLSGKIEQRFYGGLPANRYVFKRGSLRLSERTALRNFWDSMLGPTGAFFYSVPQEDQTFITTTVRFEDAPLSLEALTDAISSVGITFVEIPDTATAPSFGVSATVERFPSAGLSDALLDEVQEIIPLIRIRVIETAVPDIFFSDRRVSVGDNAYLPRLLQIGETGSSVLITQTIDGSSDDVQFTFGNADRVMILLANDTELRKARIEFSLYHVGSATKLDLWAGEIVDWSSNKGPEFTIQASDIITALKLQSPVRNISRTCWRIYANAAFGCPATLGQGTDTGNFPGSNGDTCDLGYDTANGCLSKAGTVLQSFGGVQITPQAVTIKDNSTGTWGFGRDLVTPTSQINETAYGGTLPEIWHSDDGIPQRGFSIACRVVDGREESEFYEGMGIVGRGPLGAYTVARMYDSDGDGIAETFLGSTLDGQPHHGFKQTNSSGAYTDDSLGLRAILGTDPAGPGDFFSLDRVGTTATSFREVVVGDSVFLNNFAAGVAFLVIRRTDQKGIQPSEISSHQMTAMISQGLTGFTWSGPGGRGAVAGLTNPFWVAINTFLRSLGVDALDTAIQELYFDVASAAACGTVADTTVASLVGAGTETQFRFKGKIDTLKPLRDRLQEVLNNCLGYYTWSFGKLKLGVRTSAVPETYFQPGNMIFGSLKLEPLKPSFEKLTVEFADEEFLFQQNTVDYTDQDYALRNGRVQNPQTAQIGLIGSSTKSQSARLAVVRTREELGGVGIIEQTNARTAGWRTTILALDTAAGQVVGLFDPEVPATSPAFRIQSWRLNRDWSIDITAKTVTNSMYDLTQGTVAVDISTPTLPTQANIDQGPPPAPVFLAQVAPDDAMAAEVYDLSFATTVNTRTIIQGTFTFTYDDPSVIAGPSSTKVFSAAFPYDFFLITPPAITYQAAELAWVLKAQLPGMHVSQIAGFVTNVYGDSPVTVLAVDLTLAGLPKDQADANDHYVSGYTAGIFIIRHWADREVPGGTMNGTNPTFTLAHDPDTDFSLILALNGVILDQTLDYTLSGTTITILTTIPTATDSLLAWYRY